LQAIRIIPVKIKLFLLFFLTGFGVLSIFSGYLYNENAKPQNQNCRLLLLADSILSENVELKNALLQKTSSTAIKSAGEDFKMRETE